MVERRVGVQGEDAGRGQEMEEGEARHYFPESALQARVRHFGARRKTVPLVGNTLPRFRRVGEGRPTSGVGGRSPIPWGRRVRQRFGNEGIRRRKWAGERGAKQGYLLGSCGSGGGELGRRREARPGAPGAAAAGEGGSVVGAFDGFPK